MRTTPDGDDSGADEALSVDDIRARAAEYRSYGAFEKALELYVRAGLRNEISHLGSVALEAGDADVCLEALRIVEDVRGLRGVGEFLSAFSTDYGEPFLEAASEIERERRRRRRAQK